MIAQYVQNRLGKPGETIHTSGDVLPVESSIAILDKITELPDKGNSTIRLDALYESIQIVQRKARKFANFSFVRSFWTNMNIGHQEKAQLLQSLGEEDFDKDIDRLHALCRLGAHDGPFPTTEEELGHGLGAVI